MGSSRRKSLTIGQGGPENECSGRDRANILTTKMTGEGRGERISKGRVDAEMIDFSPECMCRFVTGHAYGGRRSKRSNLFFSRIVICNLCNIQYISNSMRTCITLGSRLKTSMMWPSQNFLLYNGTVIKIKVNDRIND